MPPSSLPRWYVCERVRGEREGADFLEAGGGGGGGGEMEGKYACLATFFASALVCVCARARTYVRARTGIYTWLASGCACTLVRVLIYLPLYACLLYACLAACSLSLSLSLTHTHTHTHTHIQGCAT